MRRSTATTRPEQARAVPRDRSLRPARGSVPPLDDDLQPKQANVRRCLPDSQLHRQRWPISQPLPGPWASFQGRRPLWKRWPAGWPQAGVTSVRAIRSIASPAATTA